MTPWKWKLDEYGESMEVVKSGDSSLTPAYYGEDFYTVGDLTCITMDCADGTTLVWNTGDFGSPTREGGWYDIVGFNCQ